MGSAGQLKGCSGDFDGLRLVVSVVWHSLVDDLGVLDVDGKSQAMVSIGKYVWV